jgi:hypothetical protein
VGDGSKRWEPWQRAAVAAVTLGVGFSVLLISVAIGVQDRIRSAVDIEAVRQSSLVNVDLIDTVLLLLTIVITAAVLAQTAAMRIALDLVGEAAQIGAACRCHVMDPPLSRDGA